MDSFLLLPISVDVSIIHLVAKVGSPGIRELFSLTSPCPIRYSVSPAYLPKQTSLDSVSLSTCIPNATPAHGGVLQPQPPVDAGVVSLNPPTDPGPPTPTPHSSLHRQSVAAYPNLVSEAPPPSLTPPRFPRPCAVTPRPFPYSSHIRCPAGVSVYSLGPQTLV